MNLQDWIAIATFAIAIMGVVYAFGERDNRLATLEKDLNGAKGSLTEDLKELQNILKEYDKRLDELSIFTVRSDQRVRHLEEKIIGEQSSARLREMDSNSSHYTTINEPWYKSENSGIEM